MDHPRSDRLRPLFFIAGLAFVVLLLLVFIVVQSGPASGSDEHGRAPACHATPTASGDYVPAGPRPCTLYGHSTGQRTASKDPAPPRRTATKAPVPPHRTVTKVPVPKAPAAPPRVSLRKR